MTKKPIELYFADTPNGWKVSIMLEECKIPYKTNVILTNLQKIYVFCIQRFSRIVKIHWKYE